MKFPTSLARVNKDVLFWSHVHWRWLPPSSWLRGKYLPTSHASNSSYSSGHMGSTAGHTIFLPEEGSSQLLGGWFMRRFATRHKPHMWDRAGGSGLGWSQFASWCLSLPWCGQRQLFQLFSKGEMLVYAWRNWMFLVQQRNLSCSLTIKKTVGEALSDIIHPREVSCRKAPTKSEESKKAGQWVCTE